MQEYIVVKGAKENNLKNIDVKIPRNKLVLFTGLSGSGKSSLAFDTIFAEGQRRYMESLSSYARQFLGQMQKPDVDFIEGLSPAIAIDQKTTSNNPRSTVGTVTEIYDYLRLLYASIGRLFCPTCNKEIKSVTPDQIVKKVMGMEEGLKIMVVSPVVRGRKGEYIKMLEGFKKSGFVRVKVDGIIYGLDEEIPLEKNKKHDISVVVDRLVIKTGIESRLTEAVEAAIKLSDGLVIIDSDEKEHLYSTLHSCPECGYSFGEITPRLFSFNNPIGACPKCSGLGVEREIDANLVIPDRNLSLDNGAITVLGWTDGSISNMYYKALANKYKFSTATPIKDLPDEILNIILYGTKGEKLDMKYNNSNFVGEYKVAFEGIINNMYRRYRETQSDYAKNDIERYMVSRHCEKCDGKRLNPSALSVKINDKNIAEVTDLSIENIYTWTGSLDLTKTEKEISVLIVKEIRTRLKFLLDVGLSYLTLSRTAGTLSGGEAQRIRLATQIGSGLVGVCYILDEPSIGLHPRDTDKLIKTLTDLRDLGNTIIVVEHDEDTIRKADYIVDIGPKAGVHGGKVVVAGTVKEVEKCEKSLTGQYLSGARKIKVPQKRREGNGKFVTLKGCTQNNLKNIDANFPLGVITAVTGVSGSGKSSLVNEILYPALSNRLMRSRLSEGNYDEILGYENLDKVVVIDQSPIGRTPRSNPATYTGLFTGIRDLFASVPESKAKGYGPGRFSFNVRGGRCEVCGGDGLHKIEMHFLPDVYVTCDECKGKRYNHETLEITYKGKNINDVLEMTVEEAVKFFENIPSIKTKLGSLFDVGLGYIKLGQSATTLSGGEAQRVKLATELAKRATGKTMYILDEPTTGLHTYDVDKLITILNRLANSGNTIVVIEHNLELVKIADHIIDIGPEGGARGGKIIAEGSPEELAKNNRSYTGGFLKRILSEG